MIEWDICQCCDLIVALNWLNCFLYCSMKTIYMKPHISCLSFMLFACLVGWVCVLLLWLLFFTEQLPELFPWTFIVSLSSPSSARPVWGSSSGWNSMVPKDNIKGRGRRALANIYGQMCLEWLKAMLSQNVDAGCSLWWNTAEALSIQQGFCYCWY